MLNLKMLSSGVHLPSHSQQKDTDQDSTTTEHAIARSDQVCSSLADVRDAFLDNCIRIIALKEGTFPRVVDSED